MKTTPSNEKSARAIQTHEFSTGTIDERMEAHQRLSDKIDCYLRDVNKLISIYESRVGIRREIDPCILIKMGAARNKEIATGTAASKSHHAKIIPLFSNN